MNWAGLSAMERAERIRAARPIVESVVGHRREASVWREASRTLDIPYDALRRALDPVYQAQRCEVINRARSRIDRSSMDKRALVDGDRRMKPDPETVARLMAAIPPDTRSLTARMLGDPIPGRSALDRRRPKLSIGSM